MMRNFSDSRTINTNFGHFVCFLYNLARKFIEKCLLIIFYYRTKSKTDYYNFFHELYKVFKTLREFCDGNNLW